MCTSLVGWIQYSYLRGHQVNSCKQIFLTQNKSRICWPLFYPMCLPFQDDIIIAVENKFSVQQHVQILGEQQNLKWMTQLINELKHFKARVKHFKTSGLHIKASCTFQSYSSNISIYLSRGYSDQSTYSTDLTRHYCACAPKQVLGQKKNRSHLDSNLDQQCATPKIKVTT